MNEAHKTELRVRYAETDQMGIVHHASYVIYFEVARTQFMRQCGLNYAQMEKDGMFLAVTEVQVRYRSPARFDDLLSIETTLETTSHLTLTFAYKIFRSDPGGPRLIAEGRTTLASIDRTGRPSRIAEPWKTRVREIIGNIVDANDS